MILTAYSKVHLASRCTRYDQIHLRYWFYAHIIYLYPQSTASHIIHGEGLGFVYSLTVTD